MGKHKHHIIPKHMGGGNEPENLIELTVEEHAEAHRVLYEKYGNWQDYIAWKALSGQITSDELRREITRLTWLGRKHTPESKQKIKEKRSNQTPPNKDRKFSEEHKKNMSLSRQGMVLSDTHKKNIGKALKGTKKPLATCPHCGKIGGKSQMHQWHFDRCKFRNI